MIFSPAIPEEQLPVARLPLASRALPAGQLSERAVIVSSRPEASALIGPVCRPSAVTVKGAPAARSESRLVPWLAFRVVDGARRLRIVL